MGYSQEINVLALVKREERYVFLFDDNNRAECLRTLGEYASNPDLSFSWYDAAVLSQKIRQISEQSDLENSCEYSLLLPLDHEISLLGKIIRDILAV